MNKTIQNAVTTVIVPVSKKKLSLLLLLSLAVTAAGVWLFLHEPARGDFFYSNSKFQKAIAGAAVIIFVYAAGYFLIKMFSNKPGLIIDASGVTDNASGMAAGHIPWADITGFETATNLGSTFVMVKVKNADVYLKRIRSPFKRISLNANYKKFGTPVCISAKAIECNSSQLEQYLKTGLMQYRQAVQAQ
jgi:hypothetical protein